MKVPAVVFGAVVLALAAPSGAALITYEATGAVDGASGAITSVSVGNSYSLTFTVDDSVSDGAPSATYGYYFGAITSYSFTVGGYTASGVADLQIEDYTTSDKFLVKDLSPAGPLLDGYTPFLFQLLTLADGDTLTALSSDAIPPPSQVGFPSNPSWTYAGFFLDFGGVSMFGAVTQVQVVPEPSTAALTAFGLAGLASLGRRRDAPHVRIR